MVKPVAAIIRNLIRRTCQGFTMLEVMVVIAVLGVVGVMVFFGIQSFDQGQALLDAQRNLLVSLRTVQNKVNNGADGESVKRVDLVQGGGSYNLQTVGDETMAVSLPLGTTLSYVSGDATIIGSPISICFSNPNLTVFDSTHLCGSSVGTPCITGSGYICDRSSVPTAKSPTSLKINLIRGNSTKAVIIEGQGMFVSRMYAQ